MLFVRQKHIILRFMCGQKTVITIGKRSEARHFALSLARAALVKMISAALSLARAGPKALEGALIGLARGHAGKGKRTTLLFDISSSLNFTCLIFIYLKSILFTGVLAGYNTSIKDKRIIKKI
jgi:hypothetical protein